jgi:hypothetical protein
MAYDPATVVARYAQTIHLPDGELDEKTCALAGGTGPAVTSAGCEPGGCQNCCLGVVAVVRQLGEQAVEVETRELELADTQTVSERLANATPSKET